MKYFVTLSLFALLLCGLGEIGSTQKKPQPQSVLPTISGPNTAAQQNTNKKRTKAISQVPGTVVIPQDPTASVPPPKFTLKVDKPKARIGELVSFTLEPLPTAGQFVLDFQDRGPTVPESGEPPVVHRFLKEGRHDVSVIAKQPIGAVNQIGNFRGLTVEPVSVEVEKITLAISALPRDAKPPVIVGQQLSFATDDLKDPAVQYQFVFDEASGSGSGWLTTADTTHTYPLQGSYKVHAEMRFPGETEPTVSATREIRIDPLPPDSLALTAEPTRVVVNNQVTFNAKFDSTRFSSKFNANDQNIRYRFFFGDREESNWSPSPSTEHIYRSPGTFQPHVEVGLNDGDGTTVLLSSVTIPVEILGVNKPPPYNILILIIAGVLILTVGGSVLYFFYRRLARPTSAPRLAPSPGPPPTPSPNPPPALHPTIVLHTDEKTASVEKPNLSLSFQVRLNSGIASSRSRFNTTDAGLIKSVRRRND